jgi:hypothetical protein
MRRKLSDETNPADWFYLADDRLFHVAQSERVHGGYDIGMNGKP